MYAFIVQWSVVWNIESSLNAATEFWGSSKCNSSANVVSLCNACVPPRIYGVCIESSSVQEASFVLAFFFLIKILLSFALI